MIKDQKHTDNYSLYLGDCMEVLPSFENKSMDLVVYSPPFAGLYQYSSDHRDFSNWNATARGVRIITFLLVSSIIF